MKQENVAENPDMRQHVQPPRDGARTALLVEDEEIVRRYVHHALELEGFAVVEAADGLEALELCRSRHAEIDVLVTDVVMPVLDGRELLARLAEEGLTLPVVCMSAFSEGSILPEGVAWPAIAFLPKPFTRGELIEAIESVLAGR